jgi:predicted RNA binding protein YcfA (HicA-like mRNA interferase family)
MGGFRPLPTKCWELFLTFMGFKYKRTAASHDQWVKPGKRTIPVWGDEKEIPAQHLKTSCRTIGCDLDYLYSWATNNC